jgi:hypothetical protein
LREVNERTAELGRSPDVMARGRALVSRQRLWQWEDDARRKSDPRQLTIFDAILRSGR